MCSGYYSSDDSEYVSEREIDSSSYGLSSLDSVRKDVSIEYSTSTISLLWGTVRSNSGAFLVLDSVASSGRLGSFSSI